jgi:hypothetical protein
MWGSSQALPHKSHPTQVVKLKSLTMNAIVSLVNKELAKGLKYTILSSTPMSPPHLHRDVFFFGLLKL